MDGAVEIEAGGAESPPTSAEVRPRRITFLSIGIVLALVIASLIWAVPNARSARAASASAAALTGRIGVLRATLAAERSELASQDAGLAVAAQALSDDRGALARVTAEISTLESEIKDANKQLIVAKAAAAATASVEPQGSSSQPVPTQITPPIVCDISYDGHSFHLICHPG